MIISNYFQIHKAIIVLGFSKALVLYKSRALFYYYGVILKPYLMICSMATKKKSSFPKEEARVNIASCTDPNYSAFNKAEKWCIIVIVSYAAFSSNIGGFIYYPALKLLSENFSVSVARINLTITSYMAVAALAPTLIGDVADIWGRRLAFLITLAIYVVASICLALAKSYNELISMRVLQALGASG